MANPTPGTSFQNPYDTGTVYADGVTTALGPNYMVAGGASNALVGTLTTIMAGVLVDVAAGLRVLVRTQNTLQAGANTFNLNGSGVKDIKNIRLNNIKTSVAVGSLLDLAYDGTQWQLLNSTY